MTDHGKIPDQESIPRSVLRNIKSIRQWREERRAKRSRSDKVAHAISQFAGSMRFVYIHLVVFGGWIIANVGLIPGIPRWDPSLVVLAMAASVEAIFLSTFVLINQNQMTEEAEEKAELDLQVSLLTEQETTRLMVMTQAIVDHLGIKTGTGFDLEDLVQETQPEVILDAVAKGAPDEE